MGTIVYLKHSSSSLLDLTRAEWFLPGRRPELLWQDFFKKFYARGEKPFPRASRSLESLATPAPVLAEPPLLLSDLLLISLPALRVESWCEECNTVQQLQDVHLQIIVLGYFLAALAALNLPWIFTYWLFCILTVLDSTPSGLPDQTETLQNRWGS